MEHNNQVTKFSANSYVRPFTLELMCNDVFPLPGLINVSGGGMSFFFYLFDRDAGFDSTCQIMRLLHVTRYTLKIKIYV